MGKLIVTKWKFRETPKMFSIVKGNTKAYRDAQAATGYGSHFHKDVKPRVFDTPAKALDEAHNTEVRTLLGHQRKIEYCQERLDQIDDFELTSE